MNRLSYILPNLQTTKALAKEMETLGIDHEHIHVVGKDAAKIERANLHRASILQTTDIVPALKRGVLLGIALSVAIYVLFYISLPTSFQISGLGLVGIVFFGVAFGVWASAMIGIGIRNVLVDKYKENIEEGQYLVIADVPEHREKELNKILRDHHPDAQYAKVSRKEKADTLRTTN